MKITIEVNSDEEYRLALLKYMPMLGELGDSTVEIVKFDNVEDRTLDMMMMMDLQSVVSNPLR